MVVLGEMRFLMSEVPTPQRAWKGFSGPEKPKVGHRKGISIGWTLSLPLPHFPSLLDAVSARCRCAFVALSKREGERERASEKEGESETERERKRKQGKEGEGERGREEERGRRCSASSITRTARCTNHTSYQVMSPSGSHHASYQAISKYQPPTTPE